MSLIFYTASFLIAALSCLRTENIGGDLSKISQISSEWTVKYSSKRAEASRMGTEKKGGLSHLKKKTS